MILGSFFYIETFFRQNDIMHLRVYVTSTQLLQWSKVNLQKKYSNMLVVILQITQTYFLLPFNPPNWWLKNTTIHIIFFLTLTTLTPVNGTVISSSQDKVLNFTIFELWELVALFDVVMGVPKTICSWYLQIRRYIVPNCGHTIHIKLYRLHRMYMHNKAELTAKM